MDPEIGKAAIAVSEKLAETVGSNILKRLFSGGQNAKVTDLSLTERGKSVPVESVPRSTKNRGDRDRRKPEEERRLSPVAQRLRKGLWFEFYRKTELGKFDPLHCTNKTRDDLFDALIREAVHYRFCDRLTGTQLDASQVLEIAIGVAWADWTSVWSTESNKAVIFIESIASIMITKFNVVRSDRRRTSRRSSQPTLP